MLDYEPSPALEPDHSEQSEQFLSTVHEEATTTLPPADEEDMVSRRKRAYITAEYGKRRRLHYKQSRDEIQSATMTGRRRAMANMIGSTEQDPRPPRLSMLTDNFQSGHHLKYVGGFFFCQQCGSTSTAKNAGTSGLARVCHAPPSGGTRSILKRLRQGLLPRSHTTWPDTTGGNAQRRVQQVLI